MNRTSLYDRQKSIVPRNRKITDFDTWLQHDLTRTIISPKGWRFQLTFFFEVQLWKVTCDQLTDTRYYDGAFTYWRGALLSYIEDNNLQNL